MRRSVAQVVSCVGIAVSVTIGLMAFQPVVGGAYSTGDLMFTPGEPNPGDLVTITDHSSGCTGGGSANVTLQRTFNHGTFGTTETIFSRTVTRDASGHISPQSFNVPADTVRYAAFYATTNCFDGSGNSKLVQGFLILQVPTKLTAAPVIAKLSPLKTYLTLSATLTAAADGFVLGQAFPAGAPIPGKPIAFSAGGKPVCTATTDATGTATCGGISGAIAALLAGGYDAYFNVDPGPHQPSAAHGELVAL